jgi:hypothetical protein
LIADFWIEGLRHGQVFNPQSAITSQHLISVWSVFEREVKYEQSRDKE